MKRILSAIILCAAALSCSAQVKEYKVEVVNEYPHEVSSYTQGLFFQDGQMYESTGMNGESTFRKVDLETGAPLRKLEFGAKYFLEGSVMLDSKLYILTWTNKVAFIYDAATLEYEKTVSYPREGWGLTTDGTSLIASDGSSRLYWLDKDFRTQRTLNVTIEGRPLRYLNELEWIDGRIWANVYTTDMIVIINPETGAVEAKVDCTGLLPRKLRDRDTDVLNGIAANPEDGRIYLTGKRWKRLYEVRLVRKKDQ
ncbi:MAG: glutaminyl-peptide cyclotransferase [Bacteroidales bacterium]|nr:glutaminyl-peptide cyclotransferase [Bacteroidales bacterium]